MAHNKPTDEEATLFRELMQDVKPLGKKSKAPGDHRLHGQSGSAERDTDAESFFADHDIELVEGDAKLLHFNRELNANDKRRFTQGKMRIQDTLDLHGLTAKDSAEEVAEFILDAYADGLKCVRIIHGRGRVTGKAVLKSHLNLWLQQSQYVLAFSSCLPKDGGVGAVYVLISS